MKSSQRRSSEACDGSSLRDKAKHPVGNDLSVGQLTERDLPLAGLQLLDGFPERIPVRRKRDEASCNQIKLSALVQMAFAAVP